MKVSISFSEDGKIELIEIVSGRKKHE